MSEPWLRPDNTPPNTIIWTSPHGEQHVNKLWVEEFSPSGSCARLTEGLCGTEWWWVDAAIYSFNNVLLDKELPQ